MSTSRQQRRAAERAARKRDRRPGLYEVSPELLRSLAPALGITDEVAGLFTGDLYSRAVSPEERAAMTEISFPMETVEALDKLGYGPSSGKRFPAQVLADICDEHGLRWRPGGQPSCECCS